MSKQLKTIQKSIRMTDEVNGYVEKSEGNGFNEKFENLVLYFMKEEKAIKNRVDYLIEEEKNLNEKIRKKREILTALEQIENIIKKATSVKIPSNPDNAIQTLNRKYTVGSQNELHKCESCIYLDDCDDNFMKSHDYGDNCILYEEYIK